MGVAVVGFQGDEIDPPVAHAALGDQAVGEASDLGCRAAQDDRLQAVLVVEVAVHGGHREVVVIVLEGGEALGQLALVVVEDVGQAGDAGTAGVVPAVRLDGAADQVAHRLGAVAVGPAGDERVELARQGFVEGDGEAFHARILAQSAPPENAGGRAPSATLRAAQADAPGRRCYSAAAMGNTLLDAFALLGSLDAQLLGIVGLSLRVSLSAVLLGTLLGLPLGAWLAVSRFPGRSGVIVAINALMGLPSVVVGVIVYLLLSRSGPLGGFGLLFSPPAMIVAQTVLVTPLVAAVSRQIVEDAWRDYAPELSLIGLSRPASALLLLADCRFSLLVAILAGVGRAMSEVGAVMIVGGNIDGFTRVMTTAIALETSKGDLALSIALGIVLMALILGLNALAYGLRVWAASRFG